MSKTLIEAPITTKGARAKLKEAAAVAGVYWRGIDPEIHLGYRKHKRGGIWLVRWRVHPGYKQAPIGTADDVTGVDTLSYDAAVRKARQTVETFRKEAKAAMAGQVLTVRGAVTDYIAERDKREVSRRKRKVRSDASHRLSRYVIGTDARGKRKPVEASKLAAVPLHALTQTDLKRWRGALPETLKASAVQRLVNDLKAALNSAYATHHSRLDPSFPVTVKYGLKSNGHAEDDEPIARDNQILADAQVTRLLKAAREIDSEQEWNGDLYRLIVVLAATGARFTQIARMRVADCQPKQRRLMVPKSRKGKGKSGHTPVPVGADVIEALRPIVVGRDPDAPLLERWLHEQRPGGIEWHRTNRGQWQVAADMTRPWHAIRERAKMPKVIPYALRHSSIVRGLKAGLPTRLVAALHDTSVAMLERHYAKWIADGLEELAARVVVPLVPQDKGAKVVALRKAS